MIMAPINPRGRAPSQHFQTFSTFIPPLRSP
nr:MAG TPA: hypothetical protein [Caudoviricetes sp.]